jgi:hypothetical protein
VFSSDISLTFLPKPRNFDISSGSFFHSNLSDPSEDSSKSVKNNTKFDESSQNLAYSPVFTNESENNQISTCIVHAPSYSQSEYTKIFNFKKYSKCDTRTNDLVYFENNKIFASCEEEEPLYSVDPGLPQRLGGASKDKVSWTSDPTVGERSEYAFVKCGKSVYSLFFAQFNKTAQNRAQNIRNSRKHDKKPMNVLLFVIDSVSRFTLYKYLPTLSNYLKDLNKNNNLNDYFSVYEFTKFGIPDTHTLPNMVQILYGQSVEKMNKTIPIVNPKFHTDPERYFSFQKEKSIWDYYMNLGYVSMVQIESIFDYLSTFLGRKLSADHIFQNYWRAAWSVYGFHDVSNRQRCYGNQNSHNLTFSYTLDYFEKYENTNKFSYIHLNAAHENTGNIQTADEDTKHFLSSLTSLFQKRDENFAIFFISDHGFKFPKLFFDVRMFSEGVSPFAFLFLSKEIEEKLNAKENLIHNSEMLTGRFDVNLMLKVLALSPYEFSESELEKLKKNYEISNVVNLLTEKNKFDRSCRELGVDKNRCICSWFENIDVNDEVRMKVVDKLKGLVKMFFYDKGRDSECENFDDVKVERGQWFNIQGLNKGNVTFYELEMKVNDLVMLNASFYFCFKDAIDYKLLKSNKVNFPSTEFKMGKNTAFVQLTKVKSDKKCVEKGCLCS